MFTIKHISLPHDGIIPGARGHKKITILKGTKVYCICYGYRYFWAVYLDEQTAKEVATSLEATTKPEARRHIALDTMVAWNFKTEIPKRVSRPKV